MTYMPQDFRGTIIRQQKERSERNKQAVIDALVSSGGSIHDKYALLWKQQMDRWDFYRAYLFKELENYSFDLKYCLCRRKQLAELGSATGVYKTMMKYLVGVPEVCLNSLNAASQCCLSFFLVPSPSCSCSVTSVWLLLSFFFRNFFFFCIFVFDLPRKLMVFILPCISSHYDISAAGFDGFC